MKTNFKFKLHLSPSTRLVPHNYETYLIGAFHKWLKNSNKHGNPGGIQISHFCNYKRSEKGIKITNKSYIILSGDNREYLKDFGEGISIDPSISWGVNVVSIEPISENINQTSSNFYCMSPIIISDSLSDRKKKYYSVKSPEFNDKLTQKMKRVLGKVLPDVNLDDFSIEMSEKPNDVNKRRTSLVRIHESTLLGNFTNIKISGDLKAIEYCYYNGIGDLTGCGFGTIVKDISNF